MEPLRQGLARLCSRHPELRSAPQVAALLDGDGVSDATWGKKPKKKPNLLQ